MVDIESITGNEAAVGNYLFGELCRLGYHTEKMPVEAQRFNVYATPPEQPPPGIVFSTHMDTVPPFIPSSEDGTRIYGRGSCDAKGIIATQIAAAERLRQQGVHVGLLFVVGEERDSLGAKKHEGNRDKMESQKPPEPSSDAIQFRMSLQEPGPSPRHHFTSARYDLRCCVGEAG